MAEENKGLALRQQVETQIVQVDGNGQTILVISPELRAKYNVLAPTAIMGSGSLRFRPSVSIVSFKKEDFYKIDSKHLAPLRGALLKLADAAGVEFIPSESRGEYLPPVRVELPDGTIVNARPYRHTTALRVRRHDGTWKTWPGSATFKPDLALFEAEDAIGRWDSPPKPGTVEYNKAVRKNFMQAYKFGERMAESKAQNAAMKASGMIEQKYPIGDVEKPFLVLSFAYVSDGDATSQAIDRELVTGTSPSGPAADLYGELPPAPPISAEEWDAIPAPESEVETWEDAEVVVEASGVVEETVWEGEEPEPEAPEPEVESEAVHMSRNAALAEALQTTFPTGRNKGKTLEQVVEMDAKYIGWAADQWQEPVFREKCELVASAHAMGLLK